MSQLGPAAFETGQALAEDDPHGLDAHEAGALNLYAGDSALCPSVNSKLRNRNRRELLPFFPILKLLMNAYRKLPKYTGTVWRGVKGIDLRQKYPKGSTLCWWSLAFATVDLSRLAGDQLLGTTGVRTLFNVKVTSGAEIG